MAVVAAPRTLTDDVAIAANVTVYDRIRGFAVSASEVFVLVISETVTPNSF